MNDVVKLVQGSKVEKLLEYLKAMGALRRDMAGLTHIMLSPYKYGHFDHLAKIGHNAVG